MGMARATLAGCPGCLPGGGSTVVWWRGSVCRRQAARHVAVYCSGGALGTWAVGVCARPRAVWHWDMDDECLNATSLQDGTV